MAIELTEGERQIVYDAAAVALKDLDASPDVVKVAEEYLAIRKDGQSEAEAERTMVEKLKELFPKMAPQDRMKIAHRGMFMGGRVWFDCVLEYQLS